MLASTLTLSTLKIAGRVDTAVLALGWAPVEGIPWLVSVTMGHAVGTIGFALSGGEPAEYRVDFELRPVSVVQRAGVPELVAELLAVAELMRFASVIAAFSF